MIDPVIDYLLSCKPYDFEYDVKGQIHYYFNLMKCDGNVCIGFFEKTDTATTKARIYLASPEVIDVVEDNMLQIFDLADRFCMMLSLIAILVRRGTARGKPL